MFIAVHNQFEGQSIIADWAKFELIMFGIVQNAIKYNSENGKVVVLLRVSSIGGKALLQTTVIDTGIGIEFER